MWVRKRAVWPERFFGRSANWTAVVGEDGVDAVRDGTGELLEESGGGVAVGLGFQACEGDLGGSVDRDEEVELALCGADLGDVEVEVADGVGLELLALWLVASDLGQSADAVALEAAVQGRAGEVRDGGLEGVEAVVEGQEGVASEGDARRLVLDAEHGRAWGLGPHRQVGGGGPLAPLGDGLDVDAVAGGEGPQARLTLLDRSTNRLRRAGAAVE